MRPIYPDIPNLPLDPTAEQMAHYRWAVDAHNKAAHAEAQAATAESLSQSTAAQLALAEAMNTPMPRNRRDEAFRIALTLPQVTGQSFLNSVDKAIDMLDALDKRFP